MTLPELSIKRPVMACMLTLLVILFGVIAYTRVGIQETPNITYPVITVKTALPGGDPKLISQTITKPAEKVLNTVSGLYQLSSSSTQGMSTIELQFKLGTNLDAAYNEVESKLNQIAYERPEEARPPIISKSNSNEQPIMFLVVYGDSDLIKLKNIITNTIEPKLQNVSGVSRVQIVGARKLGVYINLKLKKMAALKITPNEIKQALESNHVSIPGGNLVTGKQSYAINLDLEYHSLDKFKHFIIAYRNNAPIYLSQVATLKLSFPSHYHQATFNGHPALGINIYKKYGANSVKIAKNVTAAINTNIAQDLSKNIHVKVAYNQGKYILSSVRNLENDLWISIIAAALVIFFFLRNYRTTLIIVVTIPVSLLGAVAGIYFFGYTFNIVTLLGLIILVGVVVDDAIVVLENVYRHINQGDTTRKISAVKGANEVFFAVLASSLSLLSIFIPVIFIGGIIGLFFKSFAVVVATGVIISLLIALTLTPVLSAYFIRISQKENFAHRALGRFFTALENGYHKCLSWTLRIPWLMIIVALIIIGLSVPVAHGIAKEFFPSNQDTGHFSINVNTPQGVSREYTINRVKQAEILLQNPNVEHYFASSSTANRASINVSLIPRSERKLTQAEIMSTLQKELNNIPGARFFLSHQGNANYLTINILGNSYQKTVDSAFEFLQLLRKQAPFENTYIDISTKSPQYNIRVNRLLARSMGVSAQDIATTLAILAGTGVRVSKFTPEDSSDRYDILLRSDFNEQIDPNNLSNIYLRDNTNNLVRLDTLAALESSLSLTEITRSNLQYNVSLSINSKIALGKSISLVQKLAKQHLPKGVELQLTGTAASLSKTTEQITFTVILILILMYIVLASQFNSFIQPFIVMVALPLALIGALLVLWIFNQTLNIYSIIGMLLCMGLVTKNSILLVDRTNKSRKSGKSIKDALLEACPLRMRPVLMTSCAIILAMLPEAILSGLNAAAHRSLAIVIIGGMISSTILTLLILPSIYYLVAAGLEWIKRYIKLAERTS